MTQISQDLTANNGQNQDSIASVLTESCALPVSLQHMKIVYFIPPCLIILWQLRLALALVLNKDSWALNIF